MTQYPDLFAELAAPFDSSEVKSRTQAGRQFHYITARTAMNRLDQILGPENWSDEYIASEKSVVCRLTVRLPDGTMLTKSDAGGYAGMADTGDDEKSGFTDAFKRAAVKFGVARYLYRDGVPQFVREALGRGGDAPHPQRPPQAAQPSPQHPPAQRQAPPPAHAQPSPQAPRNANGNGTPQFDLFKLPRPIPGRNPMFAWISSLQKHYQTVMLPTVNETASQMGYDRDMKTWDEEAFNVISSVIVDYCKQLGNYNGEFDDAQFPEPTTTTEGAGGADDDIPF